MKKFFNKDSLEQIMDEDAEFILALKRNGLDFIFDSDLLELDNHVLTVNRDCKIFFFIVDSNVTDVGLRIFINGELWIEKPWLYFSKYQINLGRKYGAYYCNRHVNDIRVEWSDGINRKVGLIIEHA